MYTKRNSIKMFMIYQVKKEAVTQYVYYDTILLKDSYCYVYLHWKSLKA